MSLLPYPDSMSALKGLPGEPVSGLQADVQPSQTGNKPIVIDGMAVVHEMGKPDTIRTCDD